MTPDSYDILKTSPLFLNVEGSSEAASKRQKVETGKLRPRIFNNNMDTCSASLVFKLKHDWFRRTSAGIIYNLMITELYERADG